MPAVMFFGAINSLAQRVLMLTSPGNPDIYQGTELWDFSLVDPDNRRPVDYGLRKKLLSRREKSPQDLLANLPDGQAKLFVIRKGLELRKKYPAVFHGGEYVPLYADAGREQNVCAFALRGGGRTIVAVAPRLFARLAEEGDAPLGRRAWGDAKLQIPDGAYTNVLTGERLDARAGVVALADLLSEFPVALLGRDETA
jgi:(1->4)-alpha-D-glucan 1-alpha-D-glucosylmutase